VCKREWRKRNLRDEPKRDTVKSKTRLLLMRIFILLGSIHALLAVSLEAFGAHGLKTLLTVNQLATYQTGVHYHLIHALALVCVGLLAYPLQSKKIITVAGWCFFWGILLFSGSLYLLSLTSLPPLVGLITPIGGCLFLLGWLSISIAAYKQPE